MWSADLNKHGWLRRIGVYVRLHADSIKYMIRVYIWSHVDEEST